MQVQSESEIAILFLAHDGVAQAHVWEEWRGDANEVRFFVHCDRATPSMNAWFVEKYKLITSIPTKRGELSVVQAVCSSMAEILQKHSFIQRIHLVSGHCVPVISVEKLVNLPHETYWPFCEEKDEQVTFQGHQFEFRQHMRYIHLCRSDALKLSSFEHFDVLHQYDIVRRKTASDTASDEWMPWAILTFNRPRPEITIQYLTYITRPDKWSSQSILWNTTTCRQTIQFGKGGVQRMSLEELWPSLQQREYCFMRKVSSEADIDIQMILNAWTYLY
jgi:hypothetical protein